MKKILLLVFLLFSLYGVAQEEYRSPLDIKLLLSANFAELRPNHFHSGIDLKTEGSINKPIYSIEDGYISRISVSPSGYGLAIYVAHTTGKTSVYGHSNQFSPAIAEYVRDKQYESESFSVDLILDKNKFPVKKGDLIAYSGNTGSSFGPHVHFEIRDTDTQRALDALVYYKKQIADTQAPVIKAIAVYPVEAQGIVNGSDKPFRENVNLLKNGGHTKLKTAVRAWGKIGLGISAIDKMDATHNVFGVKTVRLYCDNKQVFASDITGFLFEQTRMINSLIDFDYWFWKKVFYMKSFVEPGNQLPFYKTEDSGYINIDEERIYNLRYELEDLYGNKTEYKFAIEGKKMDIPNPRPCSLVMGWNHNNYYVNNDFSLNIPKGYLYNDIGFVLGQEKTSVYFSDIFSVHDVHVPLNDYCSMRLKLRTDSIANKNQYGIVILNEKDGISSWVGGKYESGYLTASIRELGHKYAVSSDNKAPQITALQSNRWVAQRKISIKVIDDKSGIASCRGTIDGQFVLFEKDVKATAYTYVFDNKRLKNGQTHKLVFSATDRCGNISSYESEFSY